MTDDEGDGDQEEAEPSTTAGRAAFSLSTAAVDAGDDDHRTAGAESSSHFHSDAHVALLDWDGRHRHRYDRDNDGASDAKLQSAEELEPRASSTKSSTHPSSSDSVDHRDDARTVDTWEFTIASSVHQPLIPPAGGATTTVNKFPQRGSASKPASRTLLQRQGTGRTGNLQSSLSKRRSLLPPPAANPRLAELTVNKLQFSRLERLYGREREVDVLRSAWETVCAAAVRAQQQQQQQEASAVEAEDEEGGATGTAVNAPRTPQGAHRHFVALAGPSGAGKSALAEALRPIVEQQGGFFLAGKCPQPPRAPSTSSSSSTPRSSSSLSPAVPLAAFAAACQELCERLVADSAWTSGSKEGDHDDDSSSHFYRWGEPEDCDADYDDRWGGARPPTSLDAAHHRRPRFTVAQVRDRQRRDLGDDAASILVRVIPGLLLLLGSKDNADERGGTDGAATAVAQAAAAPEGAESRHRFRFAFRKFLRAITALGPVALVLDDLQWADAASLELLEALVSDRENPALLVVGCYRTDDEQNDTIEHEHPIEDSTVALEGTTTSNTTATTTSTSGTTIASLTLKPHKQILQNLRRLTAEDRAVAMEEMSIGNLEVDQVRDLLADLLSSTASEVQPLADCVHKKTHGNVFFVIQYLTLLHELDLLVFQLGTLHWTWNLPAIQASTSSTDNVVSLVVGKLRGFPPALRRVLPLAACLGPALSETTLRLVLESWPCPLGRAKEEDEGERFNDLVADPASTQSTAAFLLSYCEREGLIELHGSPDDGTYQWVHDKIQEAAFALVVGDAELSAARRQLGQILMEGLDPVALEQHLFTIANLWDNPEHPVGAVNAAPPLPIDPIPVARLYLRAGQKAADGSAFEAAAAYLAAGVAWLPPDQWGEHSKLGLELLSSAAEAEFGAGNFERMRAYCGAIIEREGLPLLDKRRAYNVLIESMAAQERFLDAFALTKSLLATLGCKFPTWAIPFHVFMGIAWVKTTLKRHVSKGLAHLPPMRDEAKLWTMFLLDKFSTYTYLEKSDLLPLTIFKRLRLTLSDGLSPFAPAAFSSIGFVLAAFLHDYGGGLACVEQALEHLNLIASSKKVESRVLFVSHAFVLHWLRPLKLSLKPLLHSYEVGMATGDTESAAWSLLFYLELCLSTGMPLGRLSTDIAFYVEQLREVKQLNALVPLSTLWQAILHLSGKNEFAGRLSGDVFDADDAIRNATQNVENVRAGICVRVMYLAFLFGNHEAVYQTIKEIDMEKGTYDKLFPGAWVICPLYTFNALSLVSLHRKSKNGKCLKLARKFARKVKGWASLGNPNVIHYDALLDAEFASLLGDTHTSSTRFEVAIQYSGRSGLTQDRALAHERYGEHLLRLGGSCTEDALFHIAESLKLYEEWGAFAKVRRVQAVHGAWFAPSSSVQLELPF